MIVLSSLLILAIAILFRYIGVRFFPLIMPSSRIKTVLAGFVGGVIANVMSVSLAHLEPQVVGVYLPIAAFGVAFSILLVGLAPFLKILFGWAKY